VRVAIAAQYYWPESVGAAIWLKELATYLADQGHDVTMLTGFPNYPEGRIFPEYRGRWFQSESRDGVRIRRSFLYPSASRSLWPRAISFGSFCASSFLSGLGMERPDVLYAVLPPLPLGTAMEWLGRMRGFPVVVNIQDVYPEIAVELGYLHNRAAIRYFERMERAIYARASAVVVISEGFRANLLRKGVAPEKLHVIPNWADGELIRPAPRDNRFRRTLGVDGRICVVYSGGLTHNSHLQPLLEAAEALRHEPYEFVIIGEGIQKPELEQRVATRHLNRVRFLPFQPLDTYPEVLAASDLQVVSLHAKAGSLSLPSKLLKIMASGRPVLAITKAETELAQLVRQSGCGVTVDPEDPAGLASHLLTLAQDQARLQQMGENGRAYFQEHFERRRCLARIEAVLAQATGNR
jgi:colanic acid biosynthesis glycosyl transferase WcaI